MKTKKNLPRLANTTRSKNPLRKGKRLCPVPVKRKK